MDAIFQITVNSGAVVSACAIQQREMISPALVALGLAVPTVTLVLVGGAGRMTQADLATLRPLFTNVLAPVAHSIGAAVIDGGTNAGVMQLMGQSRAAVGGTFPLIGVAAIGTVTWPGHEATRADAAPLEPHHSHFVFVPGINWGDESPWIAQSATTLSVPKASVTVLINGGEISLQDVAHSVEERRPVVVVAGSGRSADMLAAAVRGQPADKRTADLAASGLLHVVDETTREETLRHFLQELLRTGGRTTASGLASGGSKNDRTDMRG